MFQQLAISLVFIAVIKDVSLITVRKGCKCVPYYLCEGARDDSDSVTEVSETFHKTQCPDPIEICCKVLPRKGCGYRNEKGVLYPFEIEDEDDAFFGEFPWMIILFKTSVINNSTLTVYRCGGSLIHPQVVLTAAQCVHDLPDNLYVRAGELNANKKAESLPHQQRKVDRIIIHEKFNLESVHNGIALLYLEKPFIFRKHIDIICLPKSINDTSDSDKCVASGWGKDEFSKEGRYQNSLKKVELPIVSSPKCQEFMRSTRLGEDFILDESFVCAGGVPGRDTCKGDGGSPLICPIPGVNGRYIQSGIVSWGIGCGTTLPGIYINVALFKDWIDMNMEKFNLKPDYNY